jgi:glyoxylase-like metal-dependent hydrolase (beta-lactamase superfamily II)/8-oxo-dGTP pyrophosphatase MutT (NUDIX family)
VSTITEAASVVLAAATAAPEVYLVARAPSLRFMGGFVAFPGGKVHSSDAALAEPERGLSHLHVSAVRELFEETGVLLARGGDGRHPRSSDELSRMRAQLLEDEIGFGDLLRKRGLRLVPDDLAAAGRLVTPSFAPVRFDTTFFVATCPDGQRPEIWPGELTEGRWDSAASALEAWQRGEWFLSPPTVSILQAMRGRPAAELPERLGPILAGLDDSRLPPIWWAPGVLMAPLDCKGLPPTTHTNAFLVGTGPRCLIDPGPVDPGEQDKLFHLLDEVGAGVDAVVLTHHHPDHIGAALACANRYRAPIHAHPRTAELLRGKVHVDRTIADGDQLSLGELTLTALFTPGHAPGHLAFHEADRGLLFIGDLVSTLSSIIITPNDGDLAVYLDSLQRMRKVPTRMLLPAHGPPSTRPDHVLSEALAHRREREEQLLAALADGARSINELALEMYRGLPARLLRLAELQIEAGLIKLEREGRAVRLADGLWQMSYAGREPDRRS